MATYSTSDFKKGLKVELDGEPFLMVEMDFMKPGKGQAVYRAKLKSLITGRIVDRNYRSGDTIDAAEVSEFSVQYLYHDPSGYHFMHPESYEQYQLTEDQVGDAAKWLIDETKVDVVFWNDRPITVTAPKQLELKITYTEPAAKGNTATNVQKPATVETGAEITVPAFINIGDVVKVDTREAKYVERVSKG